MAASSAVSAVSAPLAAVNSLINSETTQMMKAEVFELMDRMSKALLDSCAKSRCIFHNALQLRDLPSPVSRCRDRRRHRPTDSEVHRVPPAATPPRRAALDFARWRKWWTRSSQTARIGARVSMHESDPQEMRSQAYLHKLNACRADHSSLEVAPLPQLD